MLDTVLSLRVFVPFVNERMREKGVGQYAKGRPSESDVPSRRDGASTGVRVDPETRERLAALRRPLVDSEGNLVAFESFDRVIRRLLDERRADGTSGGRPGRTDP